MRHHALILSLILAGHLAGCSPQSSYCEESVEVLSSSSDVSALVGVSTDELLATVGTEHAIPVTFTSDDEILSQLPEGSETELTLRIVGVPGEVREVDSRYVPGDIHIDPDCRSRLEADVQVEVTTADGTFNETWDAVLSAENLDGVSSSASSIAVLTADFSPDELQGNYQITSHNDPSSPDSVRGQMRVSFRDNVSRDSITSMAAINIFVRESSDDHGDSSDELAIHSVLSQ